MISLAHAFTRDEKVSQLMNPSRNRFLSTIELSPNDNNQTNQLFPAHKAFSVRIAAMSSDGLLKRIFIDQLYQLCKNVRTLKSQCR
ncbi:MAG TPA: hypothetical protein VK141_07280 [Nitrosomonas sp.]|nr:hypothetical protein [Nitrosomonas sp.]